MSSINPELFNETYHFETSVFQDIESPDKKVQINEEIELTIKRNKETGKLLLSAFSLDNLSFLQRVSIPLYGENGKLTLGGSTTSKHLNIIGTDKKTHKNILIEVHSVIFNINKIYSVKITDEKVTSITEHRDHYLYQSREKSGILPSSSILIKGIDYPFTICSESINDTPHNLDCVSLVYSVNNVLSPPPQKIQDYHTLILGFLFGCPLVNIGYSRCDGSGKAIEIYVINPRDLTMLMSSSSIRPPIDYDSLSYSQIQEIFNEIIVNYRNLLLDIYYPGIMALLHRLWGSRLLYLDYKLLLIVSGLEVFMKIWSDQKGLDFSSKNIISKDYFKTLTSQEIKIIKQKIRDSNQISEEDRKKLYANIGEINKDKKKIKISEMYKVVGLTLTDNEFHIIHLRDQMIHEKPLILEGEVLIHADISLDAMTLCNRSLLALLEYTGQYIDYREKWQ